MNKKIVNPLTIGLIISINLFGQNPINITENTLKISSLGEEVYYCGLSEGDKLIFNFEEINGKELKELEIIELPSSSKFVDYKAKKIENKTIDINKTAIYKFRFLNSAITGRICKFKIQRIPSSDETKKFNTSVYWKTVFDTTYTPTEERFLLKADTIISEVYNANQQISSQNAFNGNKNSQVVDFYLPENTVAWSYYIGTGKEGKEAFENARNQFTQSAATTVSKIPGYGPMAALALTGVSYFNKVQGEDNVKYWFLSDANSVAMFEAGQSFMQYKKGDVVNEASQMKSPLKGKIYLALLNDNTIEPIIVTIKVTAVIVRQQFETRVVQKMSVSNRQEPYLKN